MTSTGPIPDPERSPAPSALRRAGRGALKIFLGYAPGVGKTYTMLEAARSQSRRGVEVLLGVVVTHGRTDTIAQMADLPRLPLSTVQHQGVTLEEFDLSGALKRRPALIVVDECAHANAPGARHPKRWQDIDELLDAGIQVYTTLNIQHLESLHEVIQQLTGVDVRERVPDEFIDRADDLELVDLPTVDLLERLRSGKVYHGDAATRALENFFSAATLQGLRELALRRVADRVRSQRGGELGDDAGRLLVCVGPSPHAQYLLRTTRRMAERLQAPWIALHVQTPESLQQSQHERSRTAEHLHLAERLGAEVHEVSGDQLAATVVEFARRHGVSRIVAGKPHGALWRERLFGSPVGDLIRLSGSIDVYLLKGEADGVDRPASASSASSASSAGAPLPGKPVVGLRARWDWPGYVLATGALAIATGVSALLAPHVAPGNLGMVYLLGIMLVAFHGRRGPVVAASVLGIALFDFLFVPPYYAFAVSDSQYLLTFVAMLAIGLTISHLVVRVQRSIGDALAQAAAAQALHRTSRDLATTRGTQALVAIAEQRCSEVLSCRVVISVNDAPGAATMAAAAAEFLASEAMAAGEVAVAQWVLEHGQPAGIGTETLPGAHGLHLPLFGTTGVVGVLSCLDIPQSSGQDPRLRRLIESLAKVVGLAIECDRLTVIAQAATVAADAQRLRNTLLSSISHDLRSPLAAIAGSASTLLSAEVAPARGRELLAGIAEESARMGRLVTNLLDIVRLESGTVRLTLVPMAVEDLVGAACGALGERLAGRPVAITIPVDLPPVAVDEVLMQSVLINLLDNAIKYTPAGSALTITALTGTGTITLAIADQGPGIAPDELPAIFDKFYRGAHSQGQSGAGLGLAICRSVMQAHGGTIQAANRPGGGAAFMLTLPQAQPRHD